MTTEELAAELDYATGHYAASDATIRLAASRLRQLERVREDAVELLDALDSESESAIAFAWTGLRATLGAVK
jgi:hypothetical protein